MCEDLGHAVRKGLPCEFEGSRPFDALQGRVDGGQPLAGNDAGQQDRHGLAVLACRMADPYEGAGPDHLPALGGNAHVCEPGRHGGFSRLAVPGPLHGSGFALGPLAAASGRRSTRNGHSAHSDAGRESGVDGERHGVEPGRSGCNDGRRREDRRWS